MSDKRDCASSSAESSPAFSSNQERYRPASSRSASSDLPESGNIRVRRGRNPSAVGDSGISSGNEMATGCAEPEGQDHSAFRAEASTRAPYPSTMRCAFVPVMENALIPARGGLSGARGQSTAFDVTRTGNSSQAMFGFGFSKLRCLGIIPCFIESITLIRPATPAADSRWPMFVLTVPRSSGRHGSRPFPYTAAAA